MRRWITRPQGHKASALEFPAQFPDGGTATSTLSRAIQTPIGTFQDEA